MVCTLIGIDSILSNYMNVIQQRTVRGYEERKNTYTCLKNTCNQIMTNSLII